MALHDLRIEEAGRTAQIDQHERWRGSHGISGSQAA